MRDEAGRWRGIGANRRPAAAENTRFLTADRLAVRAQKINVVDVHGSDHSAVRIEGIDGIEPAAKTHLQHIATAAALDLDRVAAWLQGRPRAPTRISRFAALAA